MSLAKYLNRSVSKASTETLKKCCTLKPMDPEYNAIPLKNGENIVGRCKETGIRDSRCSKRQLQLLVDAKHAKIQLKVVGMNPCGVNGVMVLQHTDCELQHGDLLEVVYGRHKYEVIFNKAASNNQNDSIDSPMEIEGLEPTTGERWNSAGNGKLVIYTSAGVMSSSKIAGYDMDGTIITTKSGNILPKTTTDWQIIYPEVAEKLQRLHKDGFKICFFTNQAGIARGYVDLDEFKLKVKNIVAKLKVPVQVFIAIGNGYFRKPLPGMWEHLKEVMNENVPIKTERSFFVGDAAGRPESGKGVTKKRKDHSLADRHFAANIGVSFYTPEVHFLGRRVEEWNKPEFEPSNVHVGEDQPMFEPDDVQFDADKCEMIIVVGLPGSGKSHFCADVLGAKGYKVANADTLGSIQACLTLCQRALSAGQSCVVDNTNVDPAQRKKYIFLAAGMNVSCRCFVMNTPHIQAKHNIAFRELQDPNVKPISDLVYNTIKKRYQAPTLDEGFVSIHRVNFKPKFSNEKDEKLYKMYLLEK